VSVPPSPKARWAVPSVAAAVVPSAAAAVLAPLRRRPFFRNSRRLFARRPTPFSSSTVS
jgi:hypothetical protein